MAIFGRQDPHSAAISSTCAVAIDELTSVSKKFTAVFPSFFLNGYYNPQNPGKTMVSLVLPPRMALPWIVIFMRTIFFPGGVLVLNSPCRKSIWHKKYHSVTILMDFVLLFKFVHDFILILSRIYANKITTNSG